MKCSKDMGDGKKCATGVQISWRDHFRKRLKPSFLPKKELVTQVKRWKEDTEGKMREAMMLASKPAHRVDSRLNRERRERGEERVRPERGNVGGPLTN